MKHLDRRSVLSDYAKSLRCKQTVDAVVPTAEINSEHFADSQKVESLKVSIENNLSKNEIDQAGIVRLNKSVIRDRLKFVRLYQSAETVNAFLCIKNTASFRLLAMIIDNLTSTEDNHIVFNKEEFVYYNLSLKSYNTAVKDLMLSGFLTKKLGERSYSYIVNPNILCCGKPSLTDYQDETRVRRKFKKVITNSEVMAKYGIRKDAFEEVAKHYFISTDNEDNFVKGVYTSKIEEGRVFFKIFRESFSQSLLKLKHRSSAKVIAYVINSYLPQDKDGTRISKENVCLDMCISKSTYYRCMNDMINSNILYRDSNNKRYYFNPFVWYNGSASKMFSSCKETESQSECFLTKKEVRNQRFKKKINARLYKELKEQAYNYTR
ncbi:MAG: hypothetical protein MJZ19_05455 [Paludibacteraceae bacterium]|nr:hypothetical protein [Paludibacteraceae bacterium]